jgi:branched-chain amino acid transport system ATP-binding protein
VSSADLLPRLSIRNVSLHFGGVAALSNVNLDVFQGEILAIIGPNGAGKTSLLNCISGLYHPQEGSITFRDGDGRDHELTRLRPSQVARLGIARSFQNIELFRHMSVLNNLMLGRHVRMKGSVLTCGLYWWRQQQEEIEHRRRVEEIIDFLEIENIRQQQVNTLAYGLQKRVELGRALAMEPDILLLDEPMAGMNVEEKEDMARFILDIHEEWRVTTVLIEHDMGVVMDLSSRVAALNFGRTLAEGSPEEIRNNPLVIEAYLGEGTLISHLEEVG